LVTLVAFCDIRRGNGAVYNPEPARGLTIHVVINQPTNHPT